ncbi:DNA-protecting protein DprA [Patescibacteria group bacterium]|nr:MAG: DNA-protecting protein DprA [Patescibacteria group bacterium]
MNYRAALAHFPKITYGRYKKILDLFSDLKNLWQAEMEELTQAGLEENIAHEFLLWRESNPAGSILERMKKEKIKTVSLGDPAYPALLAEINDPPMTLFYRGVLEADNGPAVAVVGTRNCTMYGQQVCVEISGALARQGITVVSGLALGLDGAAHQAALENKGRTIAVLGSGIDDAHIYPSAHRPLAQKIIAEGGAVVSEYPPGFLAAPYSFPARNRIIAGLSLGTLVVEAPEESGALITARCALDYNREVFAVPHNITSANGVGCNNQLKLGAKLVTSADDILEALNLKSLAQTVLLKKEPAASNPTEEAVLAQLSREPKHIDAVAKETGIDSRLISSTLTLLEIKGVVKNLGGMNYVVS